MRPAVLLLSSFLLLAAAPQSGPEFRAEQMQNGRVKKAVANKARLLKDLFVEKKVAWPPAGLLLRVFKEDAKVELWAKQKDGAFALVKEYPVCASSGVVGPKRREGDLQVPEGFYEVNHFNPVSQYHLALGVDYPNTRTASSAAAARRARWAGRSTCTASAARSAASPSRTTTSRRSTWRRSSPAPAPATPCASTSSRRG